jgi:hypothetical protein
MPLRDSDESHNDSPHFETVLTVRGRTEAGDRERRTVEPRTLFGLQTTLSLASLPFSEKRGP